MNDRRFINMPEGFWKVLELSMMPLNRILHLELRFILRQRLAASVSACSVGPRSIA